MEEFKREMKTLTVRLKEAENRAEQAEKQVKRLQKEVDRLEGMFCTIFTITLKIAFNYYLTAATYNCFFLTINGLRKVN